MMHWKILEQDPAILIIELIIVAYPAVLSTAAPVAEWLRPLIFSSLNRLSFTAVGSSLTRVTCETNQVLLAGGQVFFLGDLPIFRFCLTL